VDVLGEEKDRYIKVPREEEMVYHWYHHPDVF
jgi:hypothetical protein